GGSGAPLVLLHAGTGTTKMWLNQLPAFADAGYRVIAYDRRGHGRSSAGNGFAVDDLVLLLDELKLEKIHLLGTAAGGIVAFDFALSHPQRLRSLVIANSIGGVQDPDYVELQARLRPKPQFDALPAEVRELGPSYRAANPEGVRQWVALENAGPLPKVQTRNRITFSLLETLKEPTLLLTGDADLYTPPAVLARFKKHIRHAEARIIASCGHSAYWEQPEVFNREVLDFLQKH
ncbi:MAG TPA: alpha/beta hydrolase, partial [Burkholderiales bacterium]|nr:alpha/beta hydrolase [Burkholderiales bacterium]